MGRFGRLPFLLIVAAVVACGEEVHREEATTYALTLEARGFVMDTGRVVHAQLLKAGAKSGAETTTTVSGGRFTVSLPESVERGGAYVLDLYIDVDGDGRCTPPATPAAIPPQDRAYRIGIPIVLGEVSLNKPFDEIYQPGACDTFNQTMMMTMGNLVGVEILAETVGVTDNTIALAAAWTDDAAGGMERIFGGTGFVMGDAVMITLSNPMVSVRIGDPYDVVLGLDVNANFGCDAADRMVVWDGSVGSEITPGVFHFFHSGPLPTPADCSLLQ